MEISRNTFTEYALDVVDGKITACKYVQQACARFLTFFHKYDFRPDKVQKVVNFIAGIRHYQGKYAGKSFVLLPYQIWIVANIFGFYYPGTDRRVVNYIYIELARKQGKTALAAAICLYMMIADGESGSEVELLANSRQQAKIAFDLAKNFSKSKDPRGKYLVTYRDRILFDYTKSFLQILASEAGNNDGYNSYCFCLDECHEQDDSRLWDVMVSSQGARENALAMIITTAGFKLFGFCYSYRQTCIDILAGVGENDSQFCAIYTLDEDDDWANPEVWIKSNPSLGVTVSQEYLNQQVTNARLNSTLEVGTRTKNFNQWVQSSSVWLPNDLLLSLTRKVELEDFAAECCYIGVDLSAVSDLTAVSVCIPHDDMFVFKVYYYAPYSVLSNNPNSELYKEWALKGLLNITDGNVTDYDYIIKNLQEINDILTIQKIAYDKWNATQWAITCTEMGMPLEPYSQALWNFNQPTKEFERLAKSGKVIIDNNEITRYCFANVVLKSDHNQNVKPVKLFDMAKIDGVIALLESFGCQLTQVHYDNQILTL